MLDTTTDVLLLRWTRRNKSSNNINLSQSRSKSTLPWNHWRYYFCLIDQETKTCGQSSKKKSFKEIPKAKRPDEAFGVRISIVGGSQSRKKQRKKPRFIEIELKYNNNQSCRTHENCRVSIATVACKRFDNEREYDAIGIVSFSAAFNIGLCSF